MRTHTRTVRLERFYQAHEEVTAATRRALTAPGAADQMSLLGSETFDTEGAKQGGRRCIRMTVGEAHAILRLALPPSARTVPGRQEHAFLMIHMALLIEELAAIKTDTIPHTAIVAAQNLLRQVRSWLTHNNVVVMGANDRWSDSMAGRDRTPDAINRVPKPRKNPAALMPLGFPADWHNNPSEVSKSSRPETFLPWRTAANGNATETADQEAGGPPEGST